MGRIQLSKRLGLGEGAIRTIIRHLSRAGLVKSTKKGCALTSKGLSLHKHLRMKLSRILVIDAGQLALDNSSAAILVRGSSQKVKQGIEQRDAAVRVGATGACTLLMKHGRFVMPFGSEEMKMDLSESLTQELLNMFHPKQDDTIIIASANQKNLADYAALAAGLTLLD